MQTGQCFMKGPSYEKIKKQAIRSTTNRKHNEQINDSINMLQEKQENTSKSLANRKYNQIFKLKTPTIKD